jgi:flagella basal body P-ring formation protein FlgA
MNLRVIFSSLLPLAFAVLPVAAQPAPDEIAETAVAVPFSQERLVAELVRDLTAHFKFEGDLQLELLRSWLAPARTASAWQVSVLEYPATPSPSMLVRFRLFADGAPLTDLAVVVRASLWRDAWATRQPVAVGATFDPALLEARRVDVLREHDVLPAEAGDRSFVFTLSVPAGRMLTWRDISRRPLVRKGGLVEVSASDGLLLVTMKALAMQNGAQGETITVRNPESRRDFSATVIDENHVQVRF